MWCCCCVNNSEDKPGESKMHVYVLTAWREASLYKARACLD
jgi:hypothetical protein